MQAPSLSQEVRAEAGRRLDAIADADRVRIVAAVESGSRAWGFPSPDSDYDVRFIYVRPLEDYLRLAPMRDVIERPIDGLWDVNGWDLRKGLQLLCRGNAVVAEWLRSPLVYRETGSTASAMRGLIDRYGDADAATRHYHGLLRGAWRRDFEGREQVRLKKYFYVIRAAAALAWVRLYDAAPPMALPELLADDVLPVHLKAQVDELLELKTKASELGEGPRRPDLDAFIVAELSTAATAVGQGPRGPSPALVEDAEALFRAAVLETDL